MSFYKNNTLLLILLFASILRLWNLGSIPPSLTQDEASLGYNAFSILKTGKDEYGAFLPVIFKSFGDYKPGLYVYAAIPFVATLGLNEWSVRLPSALAGILIVFLIYKIVLELSLNKREQLANLSAFIASVSPWLIYFSRGAWEANLSLTLTLAGVFFLLKSFKYSKYFLYSSIFFALTLLTYQGAKLSTLIVIFSIAFSHRYELLSFCRKNYKEFYSGILVALLVTAPIVLSLFRGQTGRLSVFSIFSYPRPEEYIQAFLDEGNEKVGSLGYYAHHSELYNFVRGIAGRWYNHFSGKFLFFEGDYQNPMHSAPNSGMLLLFDLLLLPLGMLSFIKFRNFQKKSKLFILLILILSPLPAVLSRDQVQSVRALGMAVPLIIISSSGFYLLLEWIKAQKFKVFFHFIWGAFFIFSLVYFLDSYFLHFPIHHAKYWLYGYRQAVEKVVALEKNYDKIVFQQSYNQPYIFFLFYGSGKESTTYAPRKYQEQTFFRGGGSDVGLVSRVGKVNFESFSWPPALNPGEKTLIVGDSVAIPPDFSPTDYTLVSEIKFPDGYSVAFRLVEPKNK